MGQKTMLENRLMKGGVDLYSIKVNFPTMKPLD